MAEIVKETKELFDCSPDLNFEQVLLTLNGDKVRVKYIVLSLIQIVLEKSKTKGQVQVSVSVSEDDKIILKKKHWCYASHKKHRCLAQLTIRVTNSENDVSLR